MKKTTIQIRVKFGIRETILIVQNFGRNFFNFPFLLTLQNSKMLQIFAKYTSLC